MQISISNHAGLLFLKTPNQSINDKLGAFDNESWEVALYLFRLSITLKEFLSIVKLVLNKCRGFRSTAVPQLAQPRAPVPMEMVSFFITFLLANRDKIVKPPTQRIVRGY